MWCPRATARWPGERVPFRSSCEGRKRRTAAASRTTSRAWSARSSRRSHPRIWRGTERTVKLLFVADEEVGLEAMASNILRKCRALPGGGSHRHPGRGIGRRNRDRGGRKEHTAGSRWSPRESRSMAPCPTRARTPSSRPRDLALRGTHWKTKDFIRARRHCFEPDSRLSIPTKKRRTPLM